MTGPASAHAKRRFMQYLGERLPDATWSEIVGNAASGMYRKRKPHKMHPRAARAVGRGRSRCPVFDVPFRDGELVVWVPMVINVPDGIVVTVLPPSPDLVASEA